MAALTWEDWITAPKTLAKREGYVWTAQGPRGSGKNIFAIWKAYDPKDGYLQDWKNNPNTWVSGCYSNFYVEGFRKIDFSLFFDVDLAIKEPESWPYWNAFFIWDEPHREVDKRKSMTGENIEKVEIIDQLRKTGMDCIWCEKPDRTEKRMEQNSDVVVECTKTDAGFHYIESLVGSGYMREEFLSFQEASTFWNKYRTHQMIESGYKKNKTKSYGREIRREMPQPYTSSPKTPSPIDLKEVTRTPIVYKRKQPDGQTADALGNITQYKITEELKLKYPNLIASYNRGEPDVIIHEAKQVIAIKAYSIYTPDSAYGVGEDGVRRHVGAETRWLSREMASAEYLRAVDLGYDLIVWNRCAAGSLIGKQAQYTISNKMLLSWTGVLVKWEDHR